MAIQTNQDTSQKRARARCGRENAADPPVNPHWYAFFKRVRELAQAARAREEAERPAMAEQDGETSDRCRDTETSEEPSPETKALS